MRTYIQFLNFLLAISFVINSCDTTIMEETEVDSVLITKHITNSRNKSLGIDVNQKHIDSSIFLINNISNDSIKNHFLLKAAYSAYKINDSLRFIPILKKSMDISVLLNDSLKYAKGIMYRAYFYEDNKQVELAYKYYHQAKELFKKLDDKMRYGVMLSRIGKIEIDLHQYNRAENNLIESIEIFNSITRYDLLSPSYDRLGNLKYHENDFVSSIIFFEKAIDYLLHAPSVDSLNLSITENNLANCLVSAGRIEDAIKSYNRALGYTKLKKDYKQNYFRIKDNLLHAKLLHGEELCFTEEFENNRKQKKEIGDYSGVLMNRIYFSKYLEHIGHKIDAIKTMQYALDLSKTSKNTYSEIKCLERLTLMDEDNSGEYFDQFIKLKSEHEKIERETENRLGLIRMETNRYKAEKESYKKRNIWLYIVIGLLSIMTVMVIFFNRQKLRLTKIIQEKKEIDRVQQLIAKHKIEIVKAKEDTTKVISRNLHDDIASRLFGVRSNLEVLNTNLDDVSINYRKELLVELNVVEKDIRNLSRGLRNKFESDLKNAIEQLLEKAFNHNLEYHITSNFKEWNKLEENQKIEIYRIFQEIVSNINKHSNATKVWISFDLYNNDLKIEVIDNGIGFSIKNDTQGIGINNMYERAENNNIRLNIESQPNNGTIIKLTTELA